MVNLKCRPVLLFVLFLTCCNPRQVQDVTSAAEEVFDKNTTAADMLYCFVIFVTASIISQHPPGTAACHHGVIKVCLDLFFSLIYLFIYLFFLHWEMTHTLDWPKSIVIETLALWLFDESQASRQHMTQRWHLKHTTFQDGFHFTFAHSENTEMVVEPLPLHLIMGDTHYLVSTHQNSKAATTLTYVDSLQLNTNKQSPLFFYIS